MDIRTEADFIERYTLDSTDSDIPKRLQFTGELLYQYHRWAIQHRRKLDAERKAIKKEAERNFKKTMAKINRGK